MRLASAGRFCSIVPWLSEQDIVFENEDAGKALGDGVLRDSARRVPDGSIGFAPAYGTIE